MTNVHAWLKLRVVDDVETVTALPALLLGGDPSGYPGETCAKWRAALAVPGVRGLANGRISSG